MKTFLTGATGYVGGSIAVALLAAGHRVVGLARSADAGPALRELGVEPVFGTLDDADLLAEQARAADVVVNAASSDHAASVAVFLDALAGSGKAYVQTSGAGVVADKARGAAPVRPVLSDDDEFTPEPEKAARAALDRSILAAAGRGIRTVVVCPTLIYGHGLGLRRDSYQVPQLIGLARRDGVPGHVGEGLNVWSAVHVEDLADLYVLLVEKGEAGTFLYAENGEASFADVAAAIGRALGQEAPPRPLDFAAATELWGEGAATFTMSSNVRVRADRARSLGWAPSRPSVLDWIAAEVRQD
ncbi:MAG TPA: NAD-dependent epimerase/dehydratase family protein [Umezawaea sp.]|nr:NAD-dependent epimerase/dehydratase family protein [Umezawaea sp.]